MTQFYLPVANRIASVLIQGWYALVSPPFVPSCNLNIRCDPILSGFSEDLKTWLIWWSFSILSSFHWHNSIRSLQKCSFNVCFPFMLIYFDTNHSAADVCHDWHFENYLPWVLRNAVPKQHTVVCVGCVLTFPSYWQTLLLQIQSFVIQKWEVAISRIVFHCFLNLMPTSACCQPL